jgi:beta-lactamase superfamily II metal-dependent hydrolase
MNVTVRMYNTGFGDCFLLTIPAPDRPRKVLIDCGKHFLCSAGPKLSSIVETVLQDIVEDGQPRLDVVVATHRHQDHVSGFAAKGWEDVRVAEVWMPWTEDPEDPVARDVCDRQSARAAQALQGITALGAAAGDQAYLLGYAGNNLTNAAAMNLLHGGFIGNPRRRFLPVVDDKKQAMVTAALPGVEVYVLGPPRSPEVMREMDPPESESFLRAWSIQSRQLADRPACFDEMYSLAREEYEKQLGVPLEELFPKKSEDHLADVLDEPAMELLARLEEAVNATSLVLLFHVGKVWMLFPADAQWGTWEAILNDPVCARLLDNLSFYKIGHHGSHNATPIRFVERHVGASAIAMLPYGQVAKWPSIPRAGLLTRLQEKKVVLARSDQTPPAPFSSRMLGADVLSIDVVLTA